MKKKELIEYLENSYKIFLIEKSQKCYKKEVEKSLNEIIELIKNLEK
ncbi:MAG: hypothetical protein ACRCVS_03775 [Fusobacteriaceae bacterium]